MASMDESMPNRPIPICLSFVLCDRVISDAMTNQYSLIGIIQQIHANKFPARTPPITVFWELTSCHGPTPLRIEIVDVNEIRPPVMEAETTMNFQDPRAVTQAALKLSGLIFPEPGEYRLRMICHGEFVADRRIALLSLAPPQQKPDT